MRLKTVLIFVFFTFLANFNLLAQVCFVDITSPPNDTTICAGDSIYLRSEGSCNIFMNNDFENGLGVGWASANANPIFISNGCSDEYFPDGPGPSGNYCWVGTNGAFPRSITTKMFDISSGDCWVRFWMRWGRAEHSGYSDCEDPNEPDEGVHLQYSIDFGTTWLDFPGTDQYPQGINSSILPFITNTPGSGGYWTPTPHNPSGGMHDPTRYDTSSVYWWHRYSCHIPLGAITNGTMFRFLQDFNQAARSDTWGLDEVQIFCQSNPDVIWSHGPTVFNPVEPVSPTVTTDYIVMVYDTVGNFATDTVTITVVPVPDPDLGPDTTICDDGMSTAYFDAGPGFDEYLWNTGETTQVIIPIVEGWYTVTATNNNMCSGMDSVYLQVIPLVRGNAGSNESTCEEEAFDLSTSAVPPSATDYSSILWYGGLGTFDDPTALMPVYTPAPGEFGPVILSMIAYGISPCYNDTSSMVLRVFDSPESDFTYLPNNSICVNETIFFNGSSTTTIISWDWDFGDGNSASGQNVMHAYSVNGIYNVSLVVTNNRGCVDTTIYQLRIRRLPSASIAVLPDTVICAEETLTFNGSSTTTIISWDWDFGDGNTAVGQNVSHTYPLPGTYNVTLIVENENSCLDTAYQQIVINALPNADFTISPNDTSCVGEVVSFDATGSPDIISWDWNFGDGNTASGQNVTHTYLAGGTYNVYLIVANANGCLDTAIHQRVVIDLIIGFTMTPDPACEDFLVSFNGIGNASFTDWLWDFGDGNTAIGKNVTHTYPNPGSYPVSLTVCSAQVLDTLIVNPLAQNDAGSDEEMCEGTSFDLSGSSIPPTASNFSSILWTGGTGTFDDPTAVVPIYTPGPGELGTITLTMIAYGLAPCYNDTSSMVLFVIDSPESDFTCIPGDSLCVNEPILFFGTASTNVLSWLWDFGDGNIASGQNVTHTYTIDGIYNVFLVVTNDSSCVDTTIRQLEIHVLPSASISVSPDTVICAEEQLTFNGSSTTNIINWDWDFGDGNTAVGQNVLHTYPVPGTYNVKLIVENENSCMDTAYQQIIINASPTADFTISPNDTSCVGELVSFDGTGSPDIISWDWDFGDGNTATGQNVTHTYTTGGIYNVSLIVSNANGCLDTVIHQRVVIDLTIDFTMTPDPSCENFIVAFDGIGNASFTDWLWDFGDGNTAIGKNVTHTYVSANTYTVTLDVCSESVSHLLLVNPEATVNAGSDEVTCEETPINLANSTIPPSASNYSSILWFGGTGTFNDPTLVAPIYTPAPGEIGLITLTIIAYGLSPCENDTSYMILSVIANSIANAGSDESTCRGIPFDFATSSVVPSASSYDTLFWIGGTGYFVDPNAVIPVYVPDPGEIGPVTLTMVTTGFTANCDSIDEMVLTIYPDYLIAFDTTICFNDSVFAQGNWQFTSGVYYDTLQSVNTCDSIIQTNLTVRPEIDYHFIADPISACEGELIYFTQYGSANIIDFLWDFGDGQTSTLIDPVHLYASPGNYIVTLSYTDINGCSDEKSETVGVYTTAEIDFDAYPNPTCVNDSINFSGYSTFNIIQWQWDFGDGQTGIGQNIVHSYSSPGNYEVKVSGQTINGCQDSTFHTIRILRPPIADFNHYINYCDSIQFVDQSFHPAGYNLVEWTWDFGDGGSSVLQHPWHVFDSSGVYFVTLIVTSDSAGVLCNDTVTKPVIVPNGPTVYFTWDGEPTCFGNTTSFFGTSGGVITSWDWTFGDGNTATSQNPVHLYTSIDTFDVVLTVTDVVGCTESVSHSVTVVDVPGVDFTVSPNPTCRYSLTSFDGISSVNVNSWIWDYGDGGTGVGQHTDHIYGQAGTFDVIVTVDDSIGCTNSITHPLIVNNLPTADFSIAGGGCSSDTVYLSDLSHTPNGYIQQWVWDFGDGTVITIQYPDDPDTSYIYPIGGTYSVTLTVLDSDSCSHSFSRVVDIESSPIADFNNPPACDSLPVYFTDLSSINSGSPIVYWNWDFGDPASSSNTSIQQDPAHIFSVSGTYNVTLVATNIVGCSDTIVKLVVVHEIPDVDFEMSSDTVCVYDEAEFTSISSAALTYWWEFGDGGTSVEMNPVYVYEEPGTYIVTLTVVDYNGCSNSVFYVIVVDPLPWAAYDYSTPSCNGMPILFTDESSPATGYLAQWHWYFGDGTDTIIYYPDNPDISHVYSTPDDYTSSLVITSSGGCVDSTSREIIIDLGPVSLFDYSENNCAEEIIEFYDLSYAFGNTIISWQWDFGDPSSGLNNTSVLQNPTHMFNEAGTYIVTLQVNMIGGCYNISTQEVIIDQKPSVYFYTDPPSGCFGDLTYFYTDPDSTNIAEVTDYLWDFDDPATGINNISTLQNPSHLFTAPGTYNVSLTITDIDNCHNIIIREINIGAKPIADYSYEKSCILDSTQFIDESVSGGTLISDWFWNFNDPATAPYDTSSLQNPKHRFSQTGTFNVKLIITDLNGCMDTMIKVIQINDSPTSSFSFNASCDPPGTVSFKDLSWPGTGNQPIVDWFWELEPGTYSQEVNPQYIYDYSDSCYQVSLTVTDQQGCQHTSTREVCINGPLEISIALNDVCLRKRAHFDAIYESSNDTVVQWIWNFDDDTPIVYTEHDSISHLYAEAGDYLVKVSAINVDGCEFTTQEEITIHSIPVPDFTVTIATCNDPTEFTDLSTAPGSAISSWEWEFGDGEYSNLQNPVHVYGIQDSTYLAMLTLTNMEGCIDSIQKDVIKGPCLIASFEPDLQSPCNNFAACFIDGSMLYSNEYPIIRWDWDFGDGTTESYTIFQDSVCHYYNNPGSYEIELVITAMINGVEQHDSTSRNIQFALSPTSAFAINRPCINNGTWFTDLSSGNGTIITSWKWDFGDNYASNDTSSQQYPIYYYSIPGIYNVKLVTTNNLGCSDTLYKEVEIFSTPFVDFSYSLSCAGHQTFFTDETVTTQVPKYRWSWDFGESSCSQDTSNLQNPNYIYENEGNYSVMLKVTDANLCEDLKSKVIEVKPSPESYFNTISNYKGIYGRVLCENLSVGATQYMWDFDNGETSELENPQVFYDEQGRYIIQLVVMNEYQCYDTSFRELDITIQGLFVPNAFIPEGENPDLQIFKPVGINLRKYKIEIYNRWGFVIWSSMKLDREGSPAEGWDGKFRGKPLPIGDYVWKIEAEFKTGQPWQGSDVGDGNDKTYGTVTLIR